MAAKELPETAGVQPEESEFMKHLRAAGRAKAAQWKSLIPDEFWQYRREARREFLLALRTAVDSAIRELEAMDARDTQSKPPKPRPSARKTKVEVE